MCNSQSRRAKSEVIPNGGEYLIDVNVCGDKTLIENFLCKCAKNCIYKNK